jgi:hypothetical protein
LPATLPEVTTRTLRVAALAWVGFVAACDVTPEKIARWKETERGPAKLREAVQNGSLAASIRAQALAALVELGMTQEVLGDLQKAADAQGVTREAVPRLAELAGNGSKDAVTTRVQREAKDALFLLRPQMADEVKAKADEALVAWTTADLAGRMEQGGQSSEKILIAIGPRAVPRLMEVLHGDGTNQLVAANILGRIGDADARARAADALVDAAKKVVGRTRDVPDGMLKSIAMIGGPHATAFLVDQAEHGTEALRERALLALGQGTSLANDALALAAALRVAGDGKAPGKAREAGFQVLEKVGAAAVPGLVKLQGDADLTTAERAIEAALAAGKAQAVHAVLAALPAKLTKREDLDSFVVHDLGMVGPVVVPALKDELKSGSPLAKVAAIRALAMLGRAGDAAAIEPLTADKTPLKNYGAAATVGSEARTAVATLKNKK